MFFKHTPSIGTGYRLSQERPGTLFSESMMENLKSCFQKKRAASGILRRSSGQSPRREPSFFFIFGFSTIFLECAFCSVIYQESYYRPYLARRSRHEARSTAKVQYNIASVMSAMSLRASRRAYDDQSGYCQLIASQNPHEHALLITSVPTKLAPTCEVDGNGGPSRPARGLDPTSLGNSVSTSISASSRENLSGGSRRTCYNH